METVKNGTAESGTQPSGIRTIESNYFLGVFKERVTGMAALWVILLCKQKKGWYEMSLDELNKFHPNNKFQWGNLLKDGWVVEVSKGIFCVTEEFIEACYKDAFHEEEEAPQAV